MHAQYIAACTSKNSTHVGYSIFKSVWHHYMSHVRFMTPRTAVCAVCEDMSQSVQSAIIESEKVLAMATFQQHIENVKDERSFYKTMTIAAKEEYDVFRSNDHISEYSYGQCPLACSVPMSKCHYTFDFAEQVHLLNHARQIVYSSLVFVMRHGPNK